MLCFSAILISTALTASAAGADERDDEQQFYALINELRISRGLQPLVVHAELVSTARGWAQVVADAGAISHARDLSIGVTERWALLGENVGVTSNSVQRVFDAFVASPTHYRNLVESSFDHIGVGVVTGSDGRLYTVHRFMDLVGQPQPAAPAVPDPAPVVPQATAVPNTTNPPATAPTTTPPASSAPATAPPAAAPATTEPVTTVPVGAERSSRFIDVLLELDAAGI